MLYNVRQDFVHLTVMGAQIICPNAAQLTVTRNEGDLILHLLLLHAGVQEHLRDGSLLVVTHRVARLHVVQHTVRAAMSGMVIAAAAAACMLVMRMMGFRLTGCWCDGIVRIC